MKTNLTVEESVRLIELGVDRKLASLKEFVPIHPAVLKGNAKYAKPWGWFPRFRLEDILSILPKSYFSEEYYAEMNLSIAVLNGKWFVNYRYYSGGELAAQDVEREATELIDALNSLLIWCLEQKIIKLKED